MKPINKFATFAASVPVALSSGMAYCFSIWAGALKERYGLTQRQVDMIGSACNLSGLSAFFAGAVYDSFEANHFLGPRLVLVLGALIGTFGYAGLWAAATGLWHAEYWQLLVLATVACSGGTWTDTGVLVTNVRNFPHHRGTVVGIIKSCEGLSASFYAALYAGFLAPHAAGFLGLLAVGPAVAVATALPFVNHVPFVQKAELKRGWRSAQRRFIYLLLLLCVLASYLAAAALLESKGALPRASRFTAALGVLAFLVPLVLLPARAGRLLTRPAEPHHFRAAAAAAAARGDDPSTAPLLAEAVLRGEVDGIGLELGGEWAPGEAGRAVERPLTEAGEGGAAVAASGGPDGGGRGPAARAPSRPASPTRPATAGAVGEQGVSVPPPPPPSPQLPPQECVRNLDYQLLFLTSGIVTGSALVACNQAYPLVVAAGGDPAAAAPLVSLFGVASFAGRLLAGWYPEMRLRAAGVPRTRFLVHASLFSALVNLGFASFTYETLFVLFPATGFAFGSQWSLMPSLASELFGLRHFATNYAILTSSVALGGYALAGKLAGWAFERAQEASGQSGETCVGQVCFRLTFLCTSALHLFALAAAVLMYFRTRDRYVQEFLELHPFDEGSDGEEEEETERGVRSEADADDLRSRT